MYIETRRYETTLPDTFSTVQIRMNIIVLVKVIYKLSGFFL